MTNTIKKIIIKIKDFQPKIQLLLKMFHFNRQIIQIIPIIQIIQIALVIPII
jgi:hypothetical protein